MHVDGVIVARERGGADKVPRSHRSEIPLICSYVVGPVVTGLGVMSGLEI